MSPAIDRIKSLSLFIFSATVINSANSCNTAVISADLGFQIYFLNSYFARSRRDMPHGHNSTTNSAGQEYDTKN
jgi:hypothetical protein